ncbi:hypothetical protein RND81_06G238600 [Saponaria officinalis]|uniref:DUF4005 domain-containing protein n=1 Tax=Saponaria officinalis TaxID=3572 RepID=A0AAW1KDW3_SAPOF
MGKATRWFRGLLGLTRSASNPNPNPKPPKDKRRWSFVKSYREKSSSSSRPRPHSYDSAAAATAADDANKHAIAVAAATAAVAEAAVAAAQAAAAVVKLTHGGPRVSGSCGGERKLWAVVLIQSHFRGYLARRALRALKGLVKLQALVRGHIMRRKTAETMRCMQAMLRAQARARSVRAFIPESPLSSSKSCQLHQPGPTTPEKIEQFLRATSAKHDQSPKIKRNSSRSSSRTNTTNQDRGNFGSSWSDPRMDDPTFEPRVTSSTRTCKTDEDRSDRILEIDTGRPPTLRRRNLFEYPHSGPQPSDHITMAHYTVPSPSASCEVVQSLNPLKFLEETEDGVYCTAQNSPQFNSATSLGGSSRRGPFTPTKSDGSKSFLSGYSDCPSYMAYTESSRAKVRSVSAPKQRPYYDRQMGSTKRYSVHGLGEHNPRSSGRVSSMQSSFTSKAYPGSGRLDRLGLPVRDSTVVYYSGYLN